MKIKYIVECDSKEEIDCIINGLEHYLKYLHRQFNSKDVSEEDKADYYLAIARISSLKGKMTQVI